MPYAPAIFLLESVMHQVHSKHIVNNYQIGMKMMHSSVLNFLSKKARTQSRIGQFASALRTGSRNCVVCLPPHMHQVRDGKAKYH